MQAAVFFNNHFLNEQMKNKMAKAENVDVPKWDNCKNFTHKDMTGVSLHCINNCSLLYIIEQQNSPVWKHWIKLSSQILPRYDSTYYNEIYLTNAIYHRTTSFYIPK